MWDQTQIMAAIESARADLGEVAVTVESSVVEGVLRLALRDVDGALLATYSVDIDGTLVSDG